MNCLNTYIAAHLTSKEYIRRLSANSYENCRDWVDYAVGENLLFSHRRTDYTRENFPDRLHAHEFYELVVYLGGEISYVSGCNVLSPMPGDVLVSPPGRLHAARLDQPSAYERCVFYFTPEAFGEAAGEMLAFCGGTAFLRLPPAKRRAMRGLLGQISRALRETGSAAVLLGYSYIVQLFSLLAHAASPAEDIHTLPGRVAEIKTYIDESLPHLTGVSEVAEHFYYSREYLSRLFRQSFGTTVSDYIADRRLEYARQLLMDGRSVTEACFAAGYGNVSFFIKRFKEKNGLTPHQYARSREKGAQ